MTNGSDRPDRIERILEQNAERHNAEAERHDADMADIRKTLAAVSEDLAAVSGDLSAYPFGRVGCTTTVPSAKGQDRRLES